MSYAERSLYFTITLQPSQGNAARNVPANPNPTFQGTNSNTAKITCGAPAAQNGIRASAKVTRPGLPGLSMADVRLINLPLSLINQLGTLGKDRKSTRLNSSHL